jgi:hypothetical protein
MRDKPMLHLARALLLVASLLTVAPIAVAQPVLPGGGGTPGPGPGPGPAASGTAAPSGLIAKITAPALAQLLSGFSIDGKQIQTEVKTFDDNTAMVVLPFWGDKLFSGVLLDHCDKDGGGCATLQFFANVGAQSNLAPNWVNAFNGAFYGAKAYTLKSGQLLFTFELLLFTGVTKDYLMTTTAVFKNLVDKSFTFKPPS